MSEIKRKEKEPATKYIVEVVMIFLLETPVLFLGIGPESFSVVCFLLTFYRKQFIAFGHSNVKMQRPTVSYPMN